MIFVPDSSSLITKYEILEGGHPTFFREEIVGVEIILNLMSAEFAFYTTEHVGCCKHVFN